MRRVGNPKNRFSATELVYDDDAQAPIAALRVHEERVKSIVSENDSPDLPFRFSINPYRGCQHACAYCYARPSHQYWGLGAGTDFEREIIVKVNAVDRLRETFERRSWTGEPITFSGNTDCYQPLEGRYQLTRALLTLCAEYRNPVGVITKSALVARDVDVLAELSERAQACVFVSIPFASEEDARAIEPGAASIARRFQTLEALRQAGIETGVAVAPVIPGLNDGQLVAILERAHAAGAARAFMVMLRLPAEVEPVFLARLHETRPGHATKVISALRQVRQGALYNPRFGERMRGSGPRWKAIEDLFALHAKRLGFNNEHSASARPSSFRRPSPQLELFD